MKLRCAIVTKRPNNYELPWALHTSERSAVKLLVTELDRKKFTYLFFSILLKATKIVYSQSKRSSFIDHSLVFALLCFVKFFNFSNYDPRKGPSLVCGGKWQLSARPETSEECPFWFDFLNLCSDLIYRAELGPRMRYICENWQLSAKSGKAVVL